MSFTVIGLTYGLISFGVMIWAIHERQKFNRKRADTK
ncbi:MAG: hypothetical protein RL130_908 [Actinomycetota bacterium]|jgi:hypothetical protein